jgi:RNA polymerase-interacting CarD/CdnL/TRCF family regulator
MQNISIDAQRAMGLAKYDQDRKDIPPTERQMLETANQILGFA